MNPLRVDRTAATAPHRRTLRLRLAAALVLLIGVVGAVGVWWGAPRLGEGGVKALGPGMSWANDGVEITRMLVRGRPVATATARFSIRNDGRLPFTVHGLDVTDTTYWLSRQQATFLPGVPGFDEAVTPLRRSV